tara:strand:+ start:15659 stop:15793 length:135 start_codon:yes stop_codon:yes gene_type:complete
MTVPSYGMARFGPVNRREGFDGAAGARADLVGAGGAGYGRIGQD